MKVLETLIEASLNDLAAAISSSTLPSFLSIACFASVNSLARDQPCQRPFGFESLKTAKKTKEEKFAEKKEKLKENARRKKEIAKLRRRFVRTGDGGASKESDEENEGDKEEEDAEESRPGNMMGIEDVEAGDGKELEQRDTAPLRRAEAQTLERQRIRTALSAAYSDEEAKNVLKVAIDLSFGEGVMSDKEMGRLAIQVCHYLR